MGGRSTRRCGRRADRLSPRATDHVEDAAAWLLIAAGLLAAVLIGILTAAVHRTGMERAAAEAADRHQVPAEMLAAAAPRPSGTTGRPGADGERGSGHAGRVPVAAGPRADAPAAGRTILIWVDGHGRPTRPPTTPAGAAQAAATVAIALSAAVLVALVGIWLGVRALTTRLNDAHWEREWARVGPRWSGRAH